MKKIIDIVFYPLKLILLGLIYFYKFVISPLLPHCCIYYPSCSSYMIYAIKEWGVVKGVILGISRLCRCMPNRQGGEDYVPLNLKGEHKWIF